MTRVRPLLAAVVCSSIAFAQQTSTASPEEQHHGKVLFSRSTDDARQANPAPEKQQPIAAKVTDAQRAAVTFTQYDLDVHLMLKQQGIAAQARVAVRNDGDQPLSILPLQLSSTLHFETITASGHKLNFGQQLINSDADHTGQLREAVIELPQPLAPKAELTLDIGYSGEIAPSAKRLEQIGTPADIGQQSDWDEISEDFTGLRGFGDVVWYPVASEPQLLGDGAKLFSEIGRQKLRQQDASITVQVTAEYTGTAPNAAVINGQYVPVPAPQVTPTASFPGVVTFSLPEQRLGFGTPDLLLARRTAHDSSGLRVLTTEDDEPNAQGYQIAATIVQPLIEQWMGSKVKTQLTIFDLPGRDDAPYEHGAVMVTGLRAIDPQRIANALSHGMAHAYFQSPREWLDEGVANFLGTLWIEKTKGRDAAFEYLEASRGALALGEPSSPGEGTGQPLTAASDVIYYRSKATYVLWMLRDLAGDSALSKTLRSYDAAQDTSPEYFEHLLEQASGKDLKWFFDDWVYHDKGLPDLSIAGIYPSKSSLADQYLVAVDLQNDGYAPVEVPLTVRSQNTTQTDRVQIPARTKVSHRMLVPGKPTEVIVNNGVVPEIQASVHRRDVNFTDAASH